MHIYLRTGTARHETGERLFAPGTQSCCKIYPVVDPVTPSVLRLLLYTTTFVPTSKEYARLVGE